MRLIMTAVPTDRYCQLIKGVTLRDDCREQITRITLSSGTRSCDDSQNNLTNYEPSAVVPRLPWSALSAWEFEVLQESESATNLPCWHVRIGRCPVQWIELLSILAPSVITSKAANSYHFKTGQRDWPSRTEIVLPCRLLWRQVGFRAPAPRAALEHMPVV
jgi:hypothetical protein